MQYLPYLTQATKGESDKTTIKYHTHESQEVSPCLAGDHMAAINIQEKLILRNINNKNDPQKKHRLGKVSKNIFTVGLNLVSRRQPHL